MNIYLIQYNLMENYNYDVYDGFVIVANNEEEVRELAKNSHADEGKRIWETAEISKVGYYMGVEVSPFIILSSFNAG